MVSGATRRMATLDKIYTNLSDWYFEIGDLPKYYHIWSSRCNLVPCTQEWETQPSPTNWITWLLRSNDKDSKNFLACTLNNFNWSASYGISVINLKVTYFSNCIMALLDLFLRIVYRYSNDKPRITDEFRRLILRAGSKHALAATTLFTDACAINSIVFLNVCGCGFTTSGYRAWGKVTRTSGGRKPRSLQVRRPNSNWRP